MLRTNSANEKSCTEKMQPLIFHGQSENSMYILLVWIYDGSVLFVMEFQWFIDEMQSKQSTGE